jgi:hypothetical protein
MNVHGCTSVAHFECLAKKNINVLNIFISFYIYICAMAITGTSKKMEQLDIYKS